MTEAYQYPWDPPPAKPDKPVARSHRRGGGRSSGPLGRTVEPGRSGPRAGHGSAGRDRETADPAGVTDWLYNRLTISGPEARLTAFAAAAAGAGVVPWRLDMSALEEDLFHRLLTGVGRGRLSVVGCRAFAAQFRDKIEVRQAQALTLVGTSQACPFDLHALLPVPARILALGPDDPLAQDWLRTHWGTLALRQVCQLPPLPGRSYLPPGHRVARVGFFTADWSPWMALRQLRKTWPDLRFALQPVYDLG